METRISIFLERSPGSDDSEGTDLGEDFEDLSAGESENKKVEEQDEHDNE